MPSRKIQKLAWGREPADLGVTPTYVNYRNVNNKCLALAHANYQLTKWKLRLTSCQSKSFSQSGSQSCVKSRLLPPQEADGEKVGGARWARGEQTGSRLAPFALKLI